MVVVSTLRRLFRVVTLVVVVVVSVIMADSVIVANEDARERDGVCFGVGKDTKTHCHERGDAGVEER